MRYECTVFLNKVITKIKHYTTYFVLGNLSKKNIKMVTGNTSGYTAFKTALVNWIGHKSTHKIFRIDLEYEERIKDKLL